MRDIGALIIWFEHLLKNIEDYTEGEALNYEEKYNFTRSKIEEYLKMFRGVEY